MSGGSTAVEAAQALMGLEQLIATHVGEAEPTLKKFLVREWGDRWGARDWHLVFLEFPSRFLM